MITLGHASKSAIHCDLLTLWPRMGTYFHSYNLLKLSICTPGNKWLGSWIEAESCFHYSILEYDVIFASNQVITLPKTRKHIAAMYSDITWCPPHVRHKLAVVRYWSKLTRMPGCRPPRRIFEWDFNLALRKKPCWSTDVLKILENCDLEEHFSREGWHLFDTFKLSNCVKDKLMSNWYEIQKIVLLICPEWS